MQQPGLAREPCAALCRAGRLGWSWSVLSCRLYRTHGRAPRHPQADRGLVSGRHSGLVWPRAWPLGRARIPRGKGHVWRGHEWDITLQVLQALGDGVSGWTCWRRGGHRRNLGPKEEDPVSPTGLLSSWPYPHLSRRQGSLGAHRTLPSSLGSGQQLPAVGSVS